MEMTAITETELKSMLFPEGFTLEYSQFLGKNFWEARKTEEELKGTTQAELDKIEADYRKRLTIHCKVDFTEYSIFDCACQEMSTTTIRKLRYNNKYVKWIRKGHKNYKTEAELEEACKEVDEWGIVAELADRSRQPQTEEQRREKSAKVIKKGLTPEQQVAYFKRLAEEAEAELKAMKKQK